MNIEKFLARVHEMKVSEAKAIAEKIKASPDHDRGMAIMKLLSIVIMAADVENVEAPKDEAEAKPAGGLPRDTDDVRFC